jgi:multicomponent Na+:H+ antiporter subunit D
MNWTLAPFLIPLFTGLAALFAGRPGPLRRTAIGLSAGFQLVVALGLLHQTAKGRVFAVVPGAWSTELGIAIVIDAFSALMIALAAATALACVVFSFAESSVRIEHPLRLPLMQFMVAGIQLAFSTGDLFNLFVAFEVMLIASYALMTLEADDWEIKQAYPYVAINLVGSTIFICAAGLAYGMLGTLGFAEIAVRAAPLSGDLRVQGLAVLLLVVVGIKAGLFPLYHWLPNSYPILPTPLAALYAGLLTKVGVYVLIRVFGTALPHDLALPRQLLVPLAVLTMLAAVFGALSRHYLRGILAFQVLSSIGVVVLAVGLFTPLAFAAAIFYTAHDIVVKTSLFLIGGAAANLNRGDHLARMGNLWRAAPVLGVLFLLQALSLAGLPPLSGFWGKVLILQAGFQAEAYWSVAAVLLTSLLTLYSMVRIWNAVFWREDPDLPLRAAGRRGAGMTAVITGLTAVSLAFGLGAEGLHRLATRAAEAALDPVAYRAALQGLPAKDAAGEVSP